MPAKKVKQPLSVTHPELAQEADGWDPAEFTSGSGKRMSWCCKTGHKWIAPIYSRKNGRGCPVCSNYKVQTGVNDLVTTDPDIALEADGWDPTKFHRGFTKKVQWKCIHSHKYMATIDSRTRHRSGCPFCSGRNAIPGVSDISTLNPELAQEAHGWDPSTVTIQSGVKRLWRCKLGHIWLASPHKRLLTACPICAHKTLLVGFNDLSTTHPELSKEADGWNPETLFAGSHQKMPWKCPNNHKWIADVHNRAKGIGCPTCAKSGFDPNEESFIYFLQHPHWEMLQIGITNDPTTRLAKHSRNGWELLELRGPMDGHLTQQWELAILQMLKSSGADLSNNKIAGKFDGYSEAWSKSTFEVSSIKELMRLTEEFEDGVS